MFCLSNAFTWTHENFQKIITPRFSEETRTRKSLKWMFTNFFLTWLNIFSWMVSARSKWSWIEKHGLIPQFQILYLFLPEGFKVAQERASTFICCIYPQWRISSRRNDRRFRWEIATKLFRHETIFNFHMNNFDTIIENIKNKLITFKNAKQTENKN